MSINIVKVIQTPVIPEPNSLYLLKADTSTSFKLSATSLSGELFPISSVDLPASDGIIKSTGGVLETGVKGVDYVEPNTLTLFTKAQVPSTSTRLELTVNGPIDWDINIHQVLRIKTTAQSTTINPINLSLDMVGLSLQLIIMNNGGDVIWPATVKWSGAVNPALTHTVGVVDIFNFIVEEDISSTPTTPVLNLFNVGYNLNIGV